MLLSSHEQVAARPALTLKVWSVCICTGGAHIATACKEVVRIPRSPNCSAMPDIHKGFGLACTGTTAFEQAFSCKACLSSSACMMSTLQLTSACGVHVQRPWSVTPCSMLGKAGRQQLMQLQTTCLCCCKASPVSRSRGHST